MFEVGVVVHFEAAHRLRGDFGPATRLHGHGYRVEVAARGPALREDGTLCDLGKLRQAAQEATGELDYRDLGEIAAFQGKNSTVEVVAAHLFQRIAPHLRDQGLTSLAVRVWESAEAYAACEGLID
jgi:6-pyruvoyltetrahydropterin/6-carboxytetrahydropterin synthase